MKNLALWGYGFHGKDIEAVILRSRTEEFCITAIFDKRYEELNRNVPGRTFLDPDRITDYFRQGLFDAVIIGVYDAEQKHDIEIRLQVLDIPVIDDEKTLDNRFLVRRPEYFRQGQASFVWQERDGYECHTLRDIRMSFVRNCDIVFLFGEDGRILSSNWQDYQFCDAPYLRLFLPPDPDFLAYTSVPVSARWCTGSRRPRVKTFLPWPSSISKYRLCGVHVLLDLHAERTSLLAGTAFHAVFRVMLQQTVVIADRLRHAVLRAGQIQEFRHHGNVDLFRTGLTVAAVHALPHPADTGKG